MKTIETGQSKFSGNGTPEMGDSVLVEYFPGRLEWRMVVDVNNSRPDPYLVHQCGWMARCEVFGLKDEGAKS